jgi:hypothetical protein
MGWAFDLQLAQLRRKVSESLIDLVLYLTQCAIAVMKLLVDLPKAEPIRAQGSDALLALAVGTEFQGAGDRVVEDRGRFRSRISEEMLDVMVAMPGDEGHAPVEEMGVIVVEESREETTEIRMGFVARWNGIDREGQKAGVERDVSGGGRVGRNWHGGKFVSGARDGQRQGSVDV